MKLITKLKTITVIMLSALLLSSCQGKKSNVDNKGSKKIEKQEPVNKKGMLIDKTAFNSHSTVYLPNSEYGDYLRRIWIPTKLLSNGAPDPKYDIKLIKQRNISKYGNYIIFEHFKHGHSTYRNPMKDNLKNTTIHGNIKDVIPNFKPSDRKSVYIVSIHDEDYPYKDITVNNKIDEYIQKRIKTCVNSANGKNCHNEIFEQDILEIINSLVSFEIKKPGTVGGGVIPPQ